MGVRVLLGAQRSVAQRQSSGFTHRDAQVRVLPDRLRTNRKAEEPGCEPGRCGFESRRPPGPGVGRIAAHAAGHAPMVEGKRCHSPKVAAQVRVLLGARLIRFPLLLGTAMTGYCCDEREERARK